MDGVDRILAQWNRERPDLDVAPMGLIGRIKRLSLHLSREMDKTFAAHGLNGASFDVLATLRRSGPPYRLSPGDLLATMMITSGTMTHRIDLLEKAGLVKRIHNPDDGRSVIIALTDKGFSIIDAAVTAHVKTQTALTSDLPAKDRAILDELLSKFMGRFEKV
ncbi:MAG: MarR family transcriptional regulator [Rhodospirillales bacterium]|nr:MarR family transcriptional regulator [Rhodospirillales bacterium]